MAHGRLTDGSRSSFLVKPMHPSERNRHPMYAPETLALIAVAFFAAGCVKGLVGLGLPVVVLAFLALPLGVKPALSLMLIPAVATNIVQAARGGAFLALLHRLWSFLLAAAIGIRFGAKLLSAIPQETAMVAVGSLLVVYAAVSLNTPQIKPPGRLEPILSPLAGGLGGLSFGATGVFIVPGSLYLQALGLDKDRMVQALGLTFVTISTSLLGAFFAEGYMTSDRALLSAAALVPTFAGLWLGQRYRERVSEAAFRTIFFRALVLTGLYFIATNLM